MQHWYADESTSLAAREEAKAEAWLSQVWARAEAQAEREAGVRWQIEWEQCFYVKQFVLVCNMLACIWCSVHIYSIYSMILKKMTFINQIVTSINESIYGLFKLHGIVQHCVYYCIILYQWSLEASRMLCETPSGWLCEGHAATRGAVLGPSSTCAWWRSSASVVSQWGHPSFGAFHGDSIGSGLVFVEARTELQLQQRVWHVEALAEEAAAREVAGHQAEAPPQSPQSTQRYGLHIGRDERMEGYGHFEWFQKLNGFCIVWGW